MNFVNDELQSLNFFSKFIYIYKTRPIESAAAVSKADEKREVN